MQQLKMPLSRPRSNPVAQAIALAEELGWIRDPSRPSPPRWFLSGTTWYVRVGDVYVTVYRLVGVNALTMQRADVRNLSAVRLLLETIALHTGPRQKGP